MANTKLSELGKRGLVIFDGKDYFFVKEDDWRTFPAYGLDAQPALSELVKVKAAVAALQAGPDAVFLNFDRMKELDETPGTTASKAKAKTAGQIPAFKTDNVVIREGASVVAVPRDKWSQVDVGLTGDARVLVNRGAVVAAVPQAHIPAGTFCVLVNLSGITTA